MAKAKTAPAKRPVKTSEIDAGVDLNNYAPEDLSRTAIKEDPDVKKQEGIPVLAGRLLAGLASGSVKDGSLAKGTRVVRFHRHGGDEKQKESIMMVQEDSNVVTNSVRLSVASAVDLAHQLVGEGYE